MDRREALRRTALLMGGVISAPAILGVMKGCTAKPVIDWKPVFFDEHQANLVSAVAEIIIPKTDTPGAKDVGVPGFIDLILKDCYSKEEQDRFIAGLKAFDEEAKKEEGDPFNEISPESQVAIVRKVHNEAVAEEKGDHKPEHRPFILMMKELTMLGFFTSEVGAKQVLQYVAVPAKYEPCIPLSEAGNGKTWATS